MFKKKLMLFAFVLVVGLTLILSPSSGTLRAEKKSKEVLPVTVTGMPQVVVVSGTNHEMGMQYGMQAAGLIYANKIVIDRKLIPLVGEETLTCDVAVWTYYLEEYVPNLKDWLLGISAGCKKKGFRVSYADLVTNLVYPSILWSRPIDPYPEIKIKGLKGCVTPATTDLVSQSEDGIDCVSFGATKTATTDGKPFVSIAAGTTSDVVNHVILIAFPTDGYPFISLPIAGRTANNQGMNSEFAWVMPAAPAIHPTWGVSGCGFFHYLLQHCASSAEAIQYLDSTPREGWGRGQLSVSRSHGRSDRL